MYFISVLFLVLGLAIHKFKCYFLIAGYNTMDKFEKKQVNVEAIATNMGYGFYLMSLISFICGFLSRKYPNIEIVGIISIIVITIFIVIKSNKTSNCEEFKFSKSTLIPLIFPAILITVVMGISTSKINLSFEDNILNIEGNELKVSDIHEIKLLTELPNMDKSFGAGIGSNRKGTYDVDGYGECTVYTNTNENALLIKTKDTTYIVNTKDTNVASNIYNQLKNLK